MMHKMVNGEKVILSDDEEKFTLQYWKLNQTYPEYQYHCAFDGVNPPQHDMDQCRIVHASYLKKCVALALDDLRQEIESHQETDQDCTSLYAKRKAIKQLELQDLSGYSTIGDLKNSIPADLVSYWDKVFK